jgi:hypothetical protein
VTAGLWCCDREWTAARTWPAPGAKRQGGRPTARACTFGPLAGRFKHVQKVLTGPEVFTEVFTGGVPESSKGARRRHGTHTATEWLGV